MKTFICSSDPRDSQIQSILAYTGLACTKFGILIDSIIYQIDSIIYQLKLQWVVVTPTLVESTNAIHTLTKVMALTCACRDHYSQDCADHHYTTIVLRTVPNPPTSTLSMITALNSS